MRGQELYRSLLNSTPDAIVIYDVKGRVLYVNDSFSQTFGWELSEILGKRIDYVPESEREATMAVIDLVIRKGIARSGFETKRYTKDGRILDTRLSGSRYNDHEGNPAGMLVIIRDITARQRSEEQLKASLRDKEVLLREIFHRVKNNLQVISSLLRLQSRYVPQKEYRQLFIDSQNRLQSMAFIHEKLYQSKDLANIDFRGYINGLATHLFHSLGSSPSVIAFRSEIEAISMGIDTAIPCGLIANELISNSLIHAFPDDRKGEIGISLSTADHDEFELVIWDDGVGLPDGIDLRSARSLGLHLVYTLVEQLRGEITLDRSERTEFRIKFDEYRSKAKAMK
jgi:PAS domain S-box-containing protein